MTDPDDPADEHREIAARFSTTVEGVTPDQDRDRAHGRTRRSRRSGGRVAHQTAEVQRLLDDREIADTEYDFGPLGTMPLKRAIAMIYTGDVFLHRCRATHSSSTGQWSAHSGSAIS